MEIPQTADDARKRGYDTKKLTPEAARKIIDAAPIAERGIRRAAKDCSVIPQGHLCWEGECDASGWKEVLYCDGTQGCTVYAKVRCRP